MLWGHSGRGMLRGHLGFGMLWGHSGPGMFWEEDALKILMARNALRVLGLGAGGALRTQSRGFCTLGRNHHPECECRQDFLLFGMRSATLSLPTGSQGQAGQPSPAHLLAGTPSLQEPADAAAGPGHRPPGAQRGRQDPVLPECPGVPGGHGGQPGRPGLR